MNPQAEELNKVIREQNPSVYELLSERGKNIFFPRKGILGQSADAKGTKINATIGTAVEDDGSPMRLASIASKVDLDPSLIFTYAPSFGRPDIRAKWKEMLFKKNPKLNGKNISLPVVSNALTHGISMVGYLFIDQDDEVIVPNLFWGNYNLALSNAYGGKLVKFNLFKDNKFDIDSFRSSIINDKIGKKAVIMNFPNNPSGYTPTVEEMQLIVAAIKESAELGNKLAIIIDDAYFGLVFKEGVEKQSLFAHIADLHQNVLAIKVDGPTKEDYVWGFRVGFITYGTKGVDAQFYSAMESKTAGAIRGNISNSANISQSLLLQAYNTDNYEEEKAAKFGLMKARFDAVAKELEINPQYEECFKALPFNSGYFMCVQLSDGIDGEALRQLLIQKYSIGTINLGNIIRLAFSAIRVCDVPALFAGLYAACKELKG